MTVTMGGKNYSDQVLRQWWVVVVAVVVTVYFVAVTMGRLSGDNSSAQLTGEPEWVSGEVVLYGV